MSLKPILAMSVNEVLSHPGALSLPDTAFWPLQVPPSFIEILPVAIYACDKAGRVLWFNRKAAELWGRRPRIEDDAQLFCGSYKLIFGAREISPAETPMTIALRTGRPIQGAEGILKRFDGSQIWAGCILTLCGTRPELSPARSTAFTTAPTISASTQICRASSKTLRTFAEPCADA